jgi:hypothetical protein
MRIRKIIVGLTAVAALAAPSAALAAAPNGDYPGTFKNENGAFVQKNDHASLVGQLSARSIQNGQFISGNDGTYDQTTDPGSRAELIQGYLGH